MPSEILVHVDGNQKQCEMALRTAYPDLIIITSVENVGPGGGRNKLVEAAKNELIASFDDDSFPIDTDYFARVLTLFNKFPYVSILCAALFHAGQHLELDEQSAEWVSDFCGGACVYKRTAFLAAGGYVPLSTAYGMEEVDLALKLHALNGKILRTPWLRVFHDTDLKRHSDPVVTAGSIANQALLAYLRYPPSLWVVGVYQCCNRILWLLKNNRMSGILTGLLKIPFHLINHRSYRKRLTARAVKSYLVLRKNPQPIPFIENFNVIDN